MGRLFLGYFVGLIILIVPFLSMGAVVPVGAPVHFFSDPLLYQRNTSSDIYVLSEDANNNPVQYRADFYSRDVRQNINGVWFNIPVPSDPLPLSTGTASSSNPILNFFNLFTLPVYANSLSTVAGTNGWSEACGAGMSWATCHSANGYSATNNSLHAENQQAAGPTFPDSEVGLLAFDTSSLGSGITISAASTTIVGNNGGSNDPNEKCDLTSGTFASTTVAVVPSDYQGNNSGLVLWSDTEILTSAWNAAGNNQYNLNAAGIAGINGTGKTVQGFVLKSFRTNTQPAAGNGYDFCYGGNGSATLSVVFTGNPGQPPDQSGSATTTPTSSTSTQQEIFFSFLNPLLILGLFVISMYSTYKLLC